MKSISFEGVTMTTHESNRGRHESSLFLKANSGGGLDIRRKRSLKRDERRTKEWNTSSEKEESQRRK